LELPLVLELYGNYTALQLPCVIDSGTLYTIQNITKVPIKDDRNFIKLTSSGRNITAPEECVYKLYGEYAVAISAFLKEILKGSCLWSSRQGDYLWCVREW
jgi:hypothetical protein